MAHDHTRDLDRELEAQENTARVHEDAANEARHGRPNKGICDNPD